MEILKHGKTYKEHRFVCPNCECEFICNELDFEVEIEDIFGLFFDDECDRYVNCPECREKIKIKVDNETK